jgi:rod shape determining protein RodA
MVPAVLTLLQGDAGSALVFASLSLALYREGMALQVLLLGLLAITLFVFSLKLPFYFGILLILFVGILFLLITKQANWRNIALCLVTMLVVFAIQSGAPEMVAIIAFGIAATSLTLWSFMRRQAIWGLMAFMLTCSLYTQSVNYVFTNILKPHQQNRIAVVLGIVEDNRGVGYNVNQSKIAIGSGGLWGKGYLQGTQNKGNFVPEMHTDFIFCSIGEEFGLVGSVGLITLFVFLFLRLIVIGERQTSAFSRVYAYSVTAILFFHFLVNIGMTIGLMPVIGIPLPYISYGGSGLLGFTILLFILVKLDSERNAHI